VRRDQAIEWRGERHRVARSRHSARHVRRRVVALSAVVLVGGAGIVFGVGLDGFSGDISGGGQLTFANEPVRLLDTSGSGTFDGAFDDASVLKAGTTLELDVADRRIDVARSATVVLDITVQGVDEGGDVHVFGCGRDRPLTPTLRHESRNRTTTQIVTSLGSGGRVCVDTDSDVEVTVDLAATLPEDMFDMQRRRLLDASETDVESEAVVATGRLADGARIEIPLGDSNAVPDDAGPLLLTVAGETSGSVVVFDCALGPGGPTMVAGDEQVSSIVSVGPNGPSGGSLCVESAGVSDISVDLVGWFAPGAVVAVDGDARLVDTRPDGETTDALFRARGLRPAHATLQVPVAGRAGVAADASAVIVRVGAWGMDGAGQVAVYAADDRESASSAVPNIHAGDDIGGDRVVHRTVIVPLGSQGEICVSNDRATHLTVDVLGWFTQPADPVMNDATAPSEVLTSNTPEMSSPATDAGSWGRCPAQSLFPHWRMVAMYGTQRSGVLGVLGEQDPDAAAVRLGELVEAWETSERPILPAFELITVLATADAGADGMYNLAASDEFVQEYLDAARRHGIYLILDLQPGRSDFLTEAKRYEKFLRQPDVGLALDPEWRTPAPSRPVGGSVGYVTAEEVNSVSAWLADIVREEQLPEKLLVVHQFQQQMIRDKSELVEPPGIALNIHMDGLGTRAQKLDTYSHVHVTPPWSNGLKLFYDEDIDMYTPTEVLDGAFQPVPDLITYQ